MTEIDTRLIFIVGAQRSGTTWVQRLLASHPRCAGGQESHLFSGYLGPLWQRWQSEQAYRVGGGRTIGLACYLDEEDLLEEMRGLARRTLGRVLAARPGATLLVEKTPDHGLHLPLIQRLFPEAIVLHVLRDGRDVVASMNSAARTGWGHSWAARDVREAAQRWVNWVRTIQRDLSLFSRRLTLRYEELQQRGPELLAEVFDFLGDPLPLPEVESFWQRWDFRNCRSRTVEEVLILPERLQGGMLEPQGFLRSGRVGEWQESLSEQEQRVVQEEAGELLRELGYEASAPATPPAAPPSFFTSLASREDVLFRRPQSLGIIDSTNAQMLHRERLLLYSLVLALAPERCLEVGVCEGGSSRIIHSALTDLGRGRLVSIDPELHLTPELIDALSDRVQFLKLPSPQGLEEARTLAGGPFDLVLLDGDHSEGGVKRDLLGLLEVTRPGSLILAHDAYYARVDAGIRSTLEERVPLFDAGIVSTTRHPGRQGDEEVCYAGFRLLIRTEDNWRPARALVRRLRRLFR